MYWKIFNLIRKAKFQYSNQPAKSENSIKLFWWRDSHNFGDVLNYDLVNKIGNSQVEWVPYNFAGEHYMAIGSILQKANGHTVVWGSGLIDAHLQPYRKPREILAVRGPLTRRRLLDLGIPCPDVFGDPALLMPEIYYPKCEKQFDIGIIPHYVDKEHVFFQQKFSDNIKIIDVEQATCEGFIDDVLSCKRIVSSSLHGLIIADAYDIPSLQIRFSNNIYGGDFKFADYFMSVDRDVKPALGITDGTCIEDLLTLDFQYHKKVDVRNLMSTNPFK